MLTQSQIAFPTHRPPRAIFFVHYCPECLYCHWSPTPRPLKVPAECVDGAFTSAKAPTPCGLSHPQNQCLLHVKLPLHPGVSFYLQSKHKSCASLHTNTNNYCERSRSRCTITVNYCRLIAVFEKAEVSILGWYIPHSVSVSMPSVMCRIRSDGPFSDTAFSRLTLGRLARARHFVTKNSYTALHQYRSSCLRLFISRSQQIGTGAPPVVSITITAARYQRGIHFRLPCKACCRNWEHPGYMDQWAHVPTQSRHAQLPSATAFVFAVPDLKNGPFECSPSTSIRAVVATLSPLQSQGLYITCTTWRS